MNGTVDPSSRRPTAARTWFSRTPISSAIRCSMESTGTFCPVTPGRWNAVSLLHRTGGETGLNLPLEERVHDDHRQDRQGERREQRRPVGLVPGGHRDAGDALG